jgi:hypothetical protein
MLGDLKTILQHDVHHKKEDLHDGGGGHGHNHGHSYTHAHIPKHDHGHGHSHGKDHHHAHGHSDPFKKTGGGKQQSQALRYPQIEGP